MLFDASRAFSQDETTGEYKKTYPKTHKNVVFVDDFELKTLNDKLNEIDNSISANSQELYNHAEELGDYDTTLKSHAAELSSHSLELSNHATELEDHATELEDHATQLSDMTKHSFAFFNVLKYSNPVTTAGIKLAIADAVTNNGGTVYIPPLDYSVDITEYINFPHNIGFNGGFNKFIPKVANGYCFGTNSIDGINWDVEWSGSNKNNFYRCYFGNFTLDNSVSLTEGTKGIYQCDTHEIKNIYFDSMYKSIYTIRQYLDNKHYYNILCNYGKETDYQIDIYQGDGLILDNVNGASDYFLKLEQVAGGEIRSFIGGDRVYLKNCQSIKIVGWHSENGRLIIESSNITFEDSFFFKRVGITPITINQGTYGSSKPIIISNIEIVYMNDRCNYTSNEIDLQLNTIISPIILKNVSRTIEFGNGFGGKYNLGIKTNIDEFSKNSGANSIECTIINGIIKNKSHKNSAGAWNNYFVNQVSLVDASSVNLSWNKSTGTYYYFSEVIFDDTRKLGYYEHSGNEKSVTLSDTTKVVNIAVGYPDYLINNTWRLYRGLSSGQYDSYVDISIVSTGDRLSYDTGDSIGKMLFWNSRTAGVIDTLNECLYCKYDGDNVIAYCSAVPTVGTWKQGDIIINTNPSELGTAGSKYIIEKWICTVAGTTGTWIACRSLTGN